MGIIRTFTASAAATSMAIAPRQTSRLLVAAALGFAGAIMVVLHLAVRADGRADLVSLIWTGGWVLLGGLMVAISASKVAVPASFSAFRYPVLVAVASRWNLITRALWLVAAALWVAAHVVAVVASVGPAVVLGLVLVLALSAAGTATARVCLHLTEAE